MISIMAVRLLGFVAFKDDRSAPYVNKFLKGLADSAVGGNIISDDT